MYQWSIRCSGSTVERYNCAVAYASQQLTLMEMENPCFCVQNPNVAFITFNLAYSRCYKSFRVYRPNVLDA
jgi:hypothetical protein